jgi:hypothetical protein
VTRDFRYALRDISRVRKHPVAFGGKADIKCRQDRLDRSRMTPFCEVVAGTDDVWSLGKNGSERGIVRAARETWANVVKYRP